MLRTLTGSTCIVNPKPIRTRDYSVELQESGPAQLPAIYRSFHLVTVILSGEPVVVRETAGERHSTRFTPGDSGLRCAGPGSRVTWPAGVHCLHVHLHPRLIRRLGEVVLGVPDLVLQPRSRLRDPAIGDIGFRLKHLIDLGVPTDAHDLVMALAHHAVTTYPAAAEPEPRIGRLSVEEVLDTFRDETAGWQGVARLAARCGMTRSHFSRRVRAVTGLSPYRMVLASRVEAAKSVLERSGVSLSEAAYLTGFADQSHLTRVFHRATGMTPARFRTMRAGARRGGGGSTFVQDRPMASA